MTAPSATAATPLSLKLYRGATHALGPVAKIALKRRLRAGKEDPQRIGERQGLTTYDRPQGPLVWVHGASVGESLSVLPLIERLSGIAPDLCILVTTGTVTSAALMADRLPPQAIHQYVPLDHPTYVRRFLGHWHPDAAIFVESELWPVMLGALQQRGMPLALVNGRLSPTSFARWSRRPKAARALLDAFDILMGQDEENAARLSKLAGREVITVGNLKRAAPALPTDADALASLNEAMGDRPVWLAASTHPGEEEFVLEAHHQLTEHFPDLLTVIAPRHPERGGEVGAASEATGLRYSLRSRGDPLDTETQVYIADTLGELGIFYRLSDVAFIGGSLVETGGHNPMEPARLGSAIVTGPHVFNFQETFKSMRLAGGLALVRNERDLTASLIRLLSDPLTREEMAANALKWSDAGAMQVLDDTVDALRPVLDAIPAAKDNRAATTA